MYNAIAGKTDLIGAFNGTKESIDYYRFSIRHTACSSEPYTGVVRVGCALNDRCFCLRWEKEIDHHLSLDAECAHLYALIVPNYGQVIAACAAPPSGAKITAPWRAKCHRVQSEQTLLTSRRLVYRGRVGPVKELRARRVLRFYCPLLFSRYKGQYMKPPIWIEAATERRR